MKNEIRVIRKEDIVLSRKDYVVMAGDREGRFYEIFYKGKKINDVIGVIRTTIKGVETDEKKQ